MYINKLLFPLEPIVIILFTNIYTMDEFVCTCHQKHEPTERCIRHPPSKRNNPTTNKKHKSTLENNWVAGLTAENRYYTCSNLKARSKMATVPPP